jgi:hypothetical protein
MNIVALSSEYKDETERLAAGTWGSRNNYFIIWKEGICYVWYQFHQVSAGRVCAQV